MKKKFYITTPIYYPSGRFHIGTAYTTVLSDFLARYKREEGFDVKFLTGIDEHGLKIEKKAKEQGLSPKDYVDKIAKISLELWEKLNIDKFDFIRTTNPNHKETVIKIFLKMLANKDIYKGLYKGWYCIPCESFFTEIQLKNKKCPECGRKVELLEEETYFFNIKKYEKKLIEIYKKNPNFLLPHFRMQEVMNNFINKGLEDLCVSRTDTKWGINLPNDDKHVLYVWLDALCNYLTATGYLTENDSEYKKYWAPDLQIIGKDIVRFHAIYWPIFLMALDLKLPKKIYSHGFILMKKDKMSKSKGNMIYPDDLIDKYGVDAVRYFILKSLPYGNDSDFSPEIFISKYNNDLCNDLGNLLNRTISMINKYFDGEIKKTDVDKELENKVKKIINKYKENVEKLEVSNALDVLFDIIRISNKYIDIKEPWVLAKDNSRQRELRGVLYHLVENLRIFSSLIKIAMPDTSENIFNQLGIEKENQYYDGNYGKLRQIKVISKGIPLLTN